MLSQFCGGVTHWMLRRLARTISATPAKSRSLLGVIGAGGEGMRTGILLLLLCLSLHAPLGTAQGLDAAALLKPATDTWPSYNGDYSGKRYSTLDQINAGNINSLTLAWAFNTRGPVLKSTPLEVNGILYFSAPDNVWAVDARFWRMIWHYQRPSAGDHIGHRGLGMYKDWLYFTTPDAHLISLDAKDGKVRWDVELADAKLGYFSTMAPLVIRDHLIVGVSGDMTDVRGYLKSIDPETGNTQWTWYTEPDPGQPGSETWPKDGDALLHGGGMTWMPGTYDPDLNLLYWGTGNPTPVLNGSPRPGDNLYTCSIVALNPDTGKLAWSFQVSPHDTHDWDAVETPVLVDGEFRGDPEEMLMQTSRNGYFFVLDRTNGKNLLTALFGPVNWSLGVDKQGRPIPNPAKEPAPDGRLIAPDEEGLTNFRSPSFDPKTGLFIVDAHPSYGIYFAKPADGLYGWAGADYGVWGKAVLDAIDYQTGKIRWTHELGPNGAGAGVLTTDSGLIFTGDALGNVLALRTDDGKTLWHAGCGSQM